MKTVRDERVEGQNNTNGPAVIRRLADSYLADARDKVCEVEESLIGPPRMKPLAIPDAEREARLEAAAERAVAEITLEDARNALAAILIDTVKLPKPRNKKQNGGRTATQGS